MHFASYYRWLVYQYLFGTPAVAQTLLDIGCDDGGFIERLPAQLSIALDPALTALRRAQASLRVCADGTQLPFCTATFDHVVLSDVIEHVEDDVALVRSATQYVRPGGSFWLSTTAIAFRLFPDSLTKRAEQSWGHVRKGYRPEQLHALIGPGFDCTTVQWPEWTFRHVYPLMWLSSKVVPSVARIMARLCFAVDTQLRGLAPEHGHIYIWAVRDQVVAQS